MGERLVLTVLCFASIGAVVYRSAQVTLHTYFEERLTAAAARKAALIEQKLADVETEANHILSQGYDLQRLQSHFDVSAGLETLRVVSPFPAGLDAQATQVVVQGQTWWLPLAHADLAVSDRSLAIAIPELLVNHWLAKPSDLNSTAFLVSEPICTATICRISHKGVPHWAIYSTIADQSFAVVMPTATVSAPVNSLMLSWIMCSAGLAAVFLGFFVYRSRQLGRPLAELAHLAKTTQLAIELDQPLPSVVLSASAQAEVITLATAFAALSQQLHRYRQSHATTQSSLETEVELRTAALSEVSRLSQSLNVIIENVRASLDEDLILETAIVEINRALQPLVCNVALYDSSRQQATVVHERGVVASGCLNRHLSMSDAIYRYLLSGYSTQFCPLAVEGYGQVVAKLAVPIVDSDQVIGDLWVTRPANLPFLTHEQSLVSQVAAQCAIAIRQARLYHAAQDQVAVLERLNRLKDDFLSTVSHELRTPLTRLKMALQMLGIAPEKFERYHALAVTACNQQMELVDDLLSLQDLAVGCYSSTTEDVDLVDFIQETLRQQQALTVRKQQRLHVSVQPITVRLEPKPVRRIVGELVQNALKYSPPESDIAIQCLTKQDSWICTVQNPGSIPETEQERIFEKFYRIPRSDPWQHGGTGLGLALAQQLVHYLEGELELRSDDQFVTVTLSLPYIRVGAASQYDLQ